jgi:hypothetical protein
VVLASNRGGGGSCRRDRAYAQAVTADRFTADRKSDRTRTVRETTWAIEALNLFILLVQQSSMSSTIAFFDFIE